MLNSFIFFYSTVLDSSIGKPAPGVGVSLQVYNVRTSPLAAGGEVWESLANGYDINATSEAS